MPGEEVIERKYKAWPAANFLSDWLYLHIEKTRLSWNRNHKKKQLYVQKIKSLHWPSLLNYIERFWIVHYEWFVYVYLFIGNILVCFLKTLRFLQFLNVPQKSERFYKFQNGLILTFTVLTNFRFTSTEYSFEIMLHWPLKGQ